LPHPREVVGGVPSNTMLWDGYICPQTSAYESVKVGFSEEIGQGSVDLLPFDHVPAIAARYFKPKSKDGFNGVKCWRWIE